MSIFFYYYISIIYMKLIIFTFGTNKNKMKYLKKSEEMFGGKINYIIKRKWEGYYPLESG